MLTYSRLARRYKMSIEFRVEFLSKGLWTKSHPKSVVNRPICVKIYIDGLDLQSHLKLSFKYIGTNLEANQTVRPGLDEIMSKAFWTKSNSIEFQCDLLPFSLH